jgi:hypothetical protein
VPTKITAAAQPIEAACIGSERGPSPGLRASLGRVHRTAPRGRFAGTPGLVENVGTSARQWRGRPASSRAGRDTPIPRTSARGVFPPARSLPTRENHSRVGVIPRIHRPYYDHPDPNIYRSDHGRAGARRWFHASARHVLRACALPSCRATNPAKGSLAAWT